jgi:hypothetical protein
MRNFFLVALLVFYSQLVLADIPSQELIIFSAVAPNLLSSSKDYRASPNPFARKFIKKSADNRRLIAACLAFPLPVGFLGAHRIFLGTNPYIPVAYAGTLGGCLGAVPLVDFFVIVFTKNIEHFENNPHFFMWMKKK